MVKGLAKLAPAACASEIPLLAADVVDRNGHPWLRANDAVKFAARVLSIDGGCIVVHSSESSRALAYHHINPHATLLSAATPALAISLTEGGAVGHAIATNMHAFASGLDCSVSLQALVELLGPALIGTVLSLTRGCV